MSLRVVLCTAPNKAIAQQIANSLVAEKLAACVNIISGIESVYEWQDQIETDQEYQLIIKTASTCLDNAFQCVCALHPYDVPECIVLDACASEQYGMWRRNVLNNH